MSQVNTQSLLNFEKAPLTTSITPSAPQFIESRTTGGQVQLGQAAQQIGQSKETAMFAALADIAGGTAKGIDNFTRIASEIEKRKLQEVDNIFNAIDSDETLDPESKATAFDSAVKDIYTPVLGYEWKESFSNKKGKQWLSTPGRNAFEETRYNKEYGIWREDPKNNGEIETPESRQRFNSFYLTNFPTATDVDWFRRTKANVDSQVAVNMGQKLLVDLQGELRTVYNIPTKEEFNAYLKNSSNPAIKTTFENQYPAFAEVASSVLLSSNPTETYKIFFQHVMESYVNPQFTERGIPEALQFALLPEIDTLISQNVSKLMDLYGESQIISQEQQAAFSLLSASTTFEQTGNIPQFLESATQLSLGSLPPKERYNSLITLGYTLLEVRQNNPSFAELPIADQIQATKEQVQQWYESTQHKEQFNNILRATFGQKATFESWLQNSFDALIYSEEAQKLVTAQTNSVSRDLDNAKFYTQYGPNPQDTIERARENIAQNILEITETELDGFFETVPRTDWPNMVITADSVSNWYKTLSDTSKASLKRRGFDVGTFDNLQQILSKYLEVKLAKPTGQGSQKIPGLPNNNAAPEVKFAAIWDQKDFTVRRALAAYHNASKEDRDLLNQTNPELGSLYIDIQTEDTIFRGMLDSKKTMLEQGKANEDILIQEATSILNSPQATEADKARATIQKDQASKRKQNLDRLLGTIPTGASLWLDSNNEPVIQISPEFFSTSTQFVQENGNLTREGMTEYLRLSYLASRYSQYGSTESKTVFMGQIKKILEQIGNSTFDEVREKTPMLIYAAASTLSGLSNADATGIFSSFALGSNTEVLDALGAIIRQSSVFSGGIIHNLNPGEETSSLNQTIKEFQVLMDLATSPLATEGEGLMLSLLPLEATEKFTVVAQPILREIENLEAALKSSGPSSYKNPKVIVELAKRIKLKKEGTQTDEDAFLGMVQGLVPHLKPPVGSFVVIPGSGEVKWADASATQKTQYLLGQFFKEVPPGLGTKFLAGIIREQTNQPNNPIFQDGVTLSAVGRLLTRRRENTQVSSPVNYHVENNVRFNSDRIPIATGRQVRDIIPTTSDEALLVRSNLLDIVTYGISKLDGSTLGVDIEPVSWATPGREFKIGDSTYLIGETTTESEYIAQSLLSTEPTFEQFQAMFSVLSSPSVDTNGRIIPAEPFKDEKEFNEFVNNMSTRNVISPGEPFVPYGNIKRVETQGDLLKPSLLEIFVAKYPQTASRLYQPDAQGNWKPTLEVEDNLLYLSLGAYKFRLKPDFIKAIKRKREYANQNELKATRNYHRFILENLFKVQKTWQHAQRMNGSNIQ